MFSAGAYSTVSCLFNENNKSDKPIFEQIYEENLVQQKEINEIFQQNYQQRMKLIQENKPL